ncbi:pickpocket 24 [Carabus blaptoides fortunei]
MTEKWKKCLELVLKDYCNSTALHGYKYLVKTKRPKLEKIIWSAILISMLSVTLYVFNLMLDDYNNKATVTVLETSKWHVHNVLFPGIAICDVNKISRKRAMDLSKEMFQVTNISQQELYDAMKWFGKLYDFDVNNIQDVNLLQRALEKFTNSRNNYESIVNALLMLAPSCEEILVKCFWLGRERNCSEMFRTRQTMDGYCCTFNYKKRYPIDTNSQLYAGFSFKSKNQLYFADSGIDHGLTVVVRSQPDDYYYPVSSTEGLNVKLFNSLEYPDAQSGGLIDSFFPLGHEVFMQVSATTVRAMPNVEQIPIHQRDCIFPHEGETVFDPSFYSFSDCLAECKLKSILALCECVPFFMPVLKSYKFSKQICTLQDISCLNKYREKWMNIVPSIKVEELDSEMQNAVDCKHCLPSCSYTTYSVTTQYIPFVNLTNKYTGNLNQNEHSILHIYSDTEYTMLYTTDILYYWFDILSNFGGACSLFIGFSLISIVEFVYFLTIRLYSKLMSDS